MVSVRDACTYLDLKGLQMADKNPGIFGIIGGAGVKAGNELLRRIEHAVTDMGAYRDCHHPEIILWQATNAPSRSMYLEGRGPSFIEDYVDIAKKLKNSGATRILMSCNTAHYAIQTIAEKADIECINLLEQTVCTLKRDFSSTQNIGMLCSDGTKMHKLYDGYFESEYPEANIIYADDEFQKHITAGICQVKETNDMSIAHGSFLKGIQNLKDKGADVIVVACTDISLALDETDFDGAYLDTTDVLKNIVLEMWLQETDLQFELKRGT